MNNLIALTVYAKAGYRKVRAGTPRYDEFTRSLNLHDGATKGRNHYLLAKDLLQPTWLADTQTESQEGTLGFEINEVVA